MTIRSFLFHRCGRLINRFLYWTAVAFHNGINFFTLLQRIIPISNRTGKIIPAKTPIFKLSPNAPETIPTNVGPPEQPISPPNANNANIAVPPFGKAADALLKVPGHMIPTDSPQTAQAIRLSHGFGKREIPK